MDSVPPENQAAQGSQSPSADIKGLVGPAFVGLFSNADDALRHDGLDPEAPANAAAWYAALSQVLRRKQTSARNENRDIDTRVYEQIWRKIEAFELDVDSHGSDEDEVERNRNRFFPDDPLPRMRVVFYDIRQHNVGRGLTDAEGQVFTSDDHFGSSRNRGQERRLSDRTRASMAGYDVYEEEDGEDGEDDDEEDEEDDEGDEDDDDEEDDVQAIDNDPIHGNDQDNDHMNDGQPSNSASSQPQAGQPIQYENGYEAAYIAVRHDEANRIYHTVHAQDPDRAQAMVAGFLSQLDSIRAHVQNNTQTSVLSPSAGPANQPQTPAANQGGKRARTSPHQSPDSGKSTSSPAQPVLKRARIGRSGSNGQSVGNPTGRRAQPKGEKKKKLMPQDISKLSKGRIEKPGKKPFGEEWWFVCCFEGCDRKDKVKSDMQSHITWGHRYDLGYDLIIPVRDEAGNQQLKLDGEKMEHGFLIYKVEKINDNNGEWTGTADWPHTEDVHGSMIRLTAAHLPTKGLGKKKSRKSTDGSNSKVAKSSSGNNKSQDNDKPDDEHEGPSTPQRQVITRVPASASNPGQRRLHQTTLTFQLGLSPRGSGAAGSSTRAGAQQGGDEATDDADNPSDGPVNTGTEDSA